MTIERPMFPPVDSTRRQLLSVAAAGAVVAAIPGAAAAAPPTELVAKFERLLGEYYARRMIWGPRLEQAHAETDKLFGFPLDADADRNAREKFFNEAIARSGADEAHDRMHDVGEQMKPLARAIVALPTASIQALRAKALVAFWEIAPPGAGQTEFSFDDAHAFQQLFEAVVEFCGLARKVNAIGYTLPELPDLFSSCDEDEGEEA